MKYDRGQIGNIPNRRGVLLDQNAATDLIDLGILPEASGFVGIDLRNYEVTFRRSTGETLEAIADDYGLTREAIRQVVKRTYLGEIKNVIQRNKHARRISLEDHLEQVKTFILTHMGCTFEEILDQFPDFEATQIQKLGKPIAKFVLVADTRKPATVTWTDAKIIEALSQAGTYYFPLARSEYDYLIRVGEIEGPSSALIWKRFRTWTIACSTAGVESYSPKMAYSKTWSEDELLEIFTDFFLTRGIGCSIGDYEKWRSDSHPGAPSMQLLRNTFGGWSQLVELTLQSLRTSGKRD